MRGTNETRTRLQLFDFSGPRREHRKEKSIFVYTENRAERRSWNIRESIKHPTTCLDVWTFVQFGFRSRLRTFGTDSAWDFHLLRKSAASDLISSREKKEIKVKNSIFNCGKQFSSCYSSKKNFHSSRALIDSNGNWTLLNF